MAKSDYYDLQHVVDMAMATTTQPEFAAWPPRQQQVPLIRPLWPGSLTPDAGLDALKVYNSSTPGHHLPLPFRPLNFAATPVATPARDPLQVRTGIDQSQCSFCFKPSRMSTFVK